MLTYTYINATLNNLTELWSTLFAFHGPALEAANSFTYMIALHTQLTLYIQWIAEITRNVN